jgi:gliding motility-associated lipoprotein GldH
MRTVVQIGILTLLFGVLNACDPGRLHEENKLIPSDRWFYKNTIPFEVQIKDTHQLYNVYVNVRIGADYKYSNLFMWVNTTNPEKKTDQRRVEIKLADEGGKWLGSGLGDLYDYQFPVFQKIKFPNSGFYRFELEQNMRDDTLSFVKSVGVRIEEVR